MTARRLWFFHLVFGAFLMFCEKDLTGPVSRPENPIQNDVTLLASKTIGPEGGSLHVDSLIITIPALAFQDKAQLSLFSSRTDSPLDQFINSTMYQLNGLPAQFDPIDIRLTCRGPISGDTLVVIGEKAFSKSRGDSAYSFISQKALMDNGSLVFNIGSSAALNKLDSQLDKVVSSSIRFAALDGYRKTKSSNNHFEISHPAEMSAQAIELGQFFEAAYDTFQLMGFSYSGRTAVVPVQIADIPHAGEYAFFMPPNPTDASIRANLNKGRFTISTSIMNDPQQMAATAAHEFMHLIQNLYEFSDPYVKPEQLWLSEALAVWAESALADNPLYFSPELFGNEVRLFLGWQHAAAAHGYGMSTLLKKMTDMYGDAAILRIVEHIRDGNVPTVPTDPVDAVLSVISDPIERFWHQTLGDYILGNLYNGDISRTLLGNPSNYAYTFTIDGPADTLQTMLCSFNDLSGALIKIDLNFTDIDSLASLIVSLDDSINGGLMLCATKNSAINVLKDVPPGQTGSLKLTTLHQLTNAGQDLILLVSNGKHESPYDGTNDITVELRINSPQRADSSADAPQLVVPNSIDMSYWEYLRFCQTPYGHSDLLFSCRLDNPSTNATISFFKPDSGWIFNQPIDGTTALDFTGAQLGIISPTIGAGENDTLLIRVENEFGADTAATEIRVGDFFDGVTLEDSLSNWKDYFHPDWFCMVPNLDGSFSGSTVNSFVDVKNYQCGVVRSLWHSTTSRFNISLAGNKIAGTGSSDYKIVSTQAQPAEEQWVCRYTFDNPYVPALASFDDIDYFLFINVEGVSTSITRSERWTRPDSVWTDTETETGAFFLGFKGKIQN